MIENYTIEDKKLLTYSTENMQGAYVGSMDASIKRKFPGIYLQDGTAGVVFSNNINHDKLLFIQFLHLI